MASVIVNVAVQKAREAAQIYAGTDIGVRVEEVEQLSEANWNITLSWLEEDTIKRIKDNSDPLRIMHLTREPALERVYRVFQIRGDDPVRMMRAPDPQ